MAHWEYWLLALLLATDGVMGFLAPALTVSFRDIRKPFAGRASFCSAPRACTARRRRLGTVILGLRAQQAEPNFIKVSMGPGKSDQMLPLGMVSAFKRWIKQGEELRPLYNSDSMGEEDGWVDPVSFSELWLPQDLPLPLVRPALSAVVKDGVIRYIMPGLETSVQAGGKLWWNRGMCSQPFAVSWGEVGGLDLSKLRMVAYTQEGYGEAEVAVRQLGEEDTAGGSAQLKPWKKIWQASTKDVMMRLVETIADSPGDVLENGFHLLTVPDENEILMPAPEAGTRLKIILTDSPLEALYAGDTDKGDLGMIDHDGAEMDILCRKVSPGGTSEYLPKVYKELYASTAQ